MLRKAEVQALCDVGGDLLGEVTRPGQERSRSAPHLGQRRLSLWSQKPSHRDTSPSPCPHARAVRRPTAAYSVPKAAVAGAGARTPRVPARPSAGQCTLGLCALRRSRRRRSPRRRRGRSRPCSGAGGRGPAPLSEAWVLQAGWSADGALPREKYRRRVDDPSVVMAVSAWVSSGTVSARRRQRQLRHREHPQRPSTEAHGPFELDSGPAQGHPRRATDPADGLEETRGCARRPRYRSCSPTAWPRGSELRWHAASQARERLAVDEPSEALRRCPSTKTSVCRR